MLAIYVLEFNTDASAIFYWHSDYQVYKLDLTTTSNTVIAGYNYAPDNAGVDGIGTAVQWSGHSYFFKLRSDGMLVTHERESDNLRLVTVETHADVFTGCAACPAGKTSLFGSDAEADCGCAAGAYSQSSLAYTDDSMAWGTNAQAVFLEASGVAPYHAFADMIVWPETNYIFAVKTNANSNNLHELIRIDTSSGQIEVVFEFNGVSYLSSLASNSDYTKLYLIDKQFSYNTNNELIGSNIYEIDIMSCCPSSAVVKFQLVYTAEVFNIGNSLYVTAGYSGSVAVAAGHELEPGLYDCNLLSSVCTMIVVKSAWHWLSVKPTPDNKFMFLFNTWDGPLYNYSTSNNDVSIHVWFSYDRCRPHDFHIASNI
jgi:hypothetical protein